MNNAPILGFFFLTKTLVRLSTSPQFRHSTLVKIQSPLGKRGLLCAAVLMLFASRSGAFEPLAQSASLQTVLDNSGLSTTDSLTTRYTVNDRLPIDYTLGDGAHLASQNAQINADGATVELAATAEVIQPGAPEFGSITSQSVYELSFRASPGAMFDLSGTVDVAFDFFHFNDVAHVSLRGPGVDVAESFAADNDTEYQFSGNLPGGTYVWQMRAFGAGAFDAAWVDQLTGQLQVQPSDQPADDTPPGLFELGEVRRDSIVGPGHFQRHLTTTHLVEDKANRAETTETTGQTSFVSNRLVQATGMESDLSVDFTALAGTSTFRVSGHFDGDGHLMVQRRDGCDTCWQDVVAFRGIPDGQRFFGQTLELPPQHYRLTAGGNFDMWLLPVIPGDLNEDTWVDAEDINALTDAVLDGSTDVRWDLTGDMQVDADDRRHWVEQLAGSTFGDTNLDGTFDSTDLVLVFQANEYEDSIADNSSWQTGDWNGDREFTTDDFVFALQHSVYDGQSTGPRQAKSAAAVPEPSLLCSACWALFFIACCIDRRRINERKGGAW